MLDNPGTGETWSIVDQVPPCCALVNFQYFINLRSPSRVLVAVTAIISSGAVRKSSTNQAKSTRRQDKRRTICEAKT